MTFLLFCGFNESYCQLIVKQCALRIGKLLLRGLLRLNMFKIADTSGKASDSGARGWGFDPHSGRCVVTLRKMHLPPKKYW